MDSVNINDLPSGATYLTRAREMESDCEQLTLAGLAEFGTKAPQCLAALGELFVRMDAVASCVWCCLPGDHRLEYVAGRLLSSARSSFILLQRGFYDESLNLTRSIGEIANLFFLFAQDRASFNRWNMLGDSARRREFSPVKVRLAIEEKGLTIPIDKERYSSLSEVAAHIGPHTRPNLHVSGERPKLGGHFALPSSLAALNELAGAFAVASFSIAQIMDLPKEKKLEVMLCARDLLSQVGAVSLVQLRLGKFGESEKNNQIERAETDKQFRHA